jgi:hypothetical protein
MFVACYERRVDKLVPQEYAKLFAYPNEPKYSSTLTILDSGAFYFYMSKRARPANYIESLRSYYEKYGQVAGTYCAVPDVVLSPAKTMRAYEEWYKVSPTVKVFPVLQCTSTCLDLSLLTKQLEFYKALVKGGLTPELDFIALANPGISPLEAKHELAFLRRLISLYHPSAWAHVFGAGFSARDVYDWHSCGFDSIDSISYYTDAQRGVCWKSKSYEKEVFDIKQVDWTTIALKNLELALASAYDNYDT